MTLAPPRSQKSDVRPIAFVLDDQTAQGSRPLVLSLYVRPEELTRTSPSRMAAHHTFGGAFADSWGSGVQTINLSGTTGWRRDQADAQDGLQRFTALYEQVFEGWHSRRRAAVQAGRNPDGVKLVLADALDDFAVVVAPVTFVLRRSKSRPLLAQFQIQLLVTELKIDQQFLQQALADTAAARRAALPAGIESLLGSIERLAGFVKTAQEFIDTPLLGPVRAFLTVTQAIYRRVSDAVRTVDGVAESLIEVARLSAQAGTNLFRSLSAVTSLPTRIRGRLMEVAAAYTNVVCVLSNSLRRRSYYTEYSALYGASNCSSTNGGRAPSPLAGANPFFSLAPAAATAQATVSQNAQDSLRSLANADVVAAPVPVTALGGLVNAINGGLAVA